MLRTLTNVEPLLTLEVRRSLSVRMRKQNGTNGGRLIICLTTVVVVVPLSPRLTQDLSP